MKTSFIGGAKEESVLRPIEARVEHSARASAGTWDVFTEEVNGGRNKGSQVTQSDLHVSQVTLQTASVPNFQYKHVFHGGSEHRTVLSFLSGVGSLEIHAISQETEQEQPPKPVFPEARGLWCTGPGARTSGHMIRRLVFFSPLFHSVYFKDKVVFLAHSNVSQRQASLPPFTFFFFFLVTKRRQVGDLRAFGKRQPLIEFCGIDLLYSLHNSIGLLSRANVCQGPNKTVGPLN